MMNWWKKQTRGTKGKYRLIFFLIIVIISYPTNSSLFFLCTGAIAGLGVGWNSMEAIFGNVLERHENDRG